MTAIIPAGATIPEVAHQSLAIDGVDIHYVSAGSHGSPILLVHGFPESWWTFHKLIPLLAAQHRVFAVDLPGFGDSGLSSGGSSEAAEALHALITELGLGPVFVSGQDISGSTVFRLAVTHPEDVAGLIAIETGLPGFGWERLADLAHGGAWQIGVLAAPGIPDMLLSGRERAFIGDFAFPAMTAVPGSVTAADIDEFVRSYSRSHGFDGASAIYRSLLSEGSELSALTIDVPTLTIGAGGGSFTQGSVSQAVTGAVTSVLLDGVGHYAALEAPERVARAILDFIQ